jgi:hypothetical protein
MSDNEGSIYVEESSVDEFDELQEDIDVDLEDEAEENKPIDEQLQEENEDDEDEEEEKKVKEIIIKKLDKPKELITKELYNTETIRVVAPEDRRSRPIISAGEKAALLAYRVATIQNGEPYYLPPGIPVPTNPIDIAVLEMKHLSSPLLIMRNMGKTIEMWSPNEMIHPRSDV